VGGQAEGHGAEQGDRRRHCNIFAGFV
jgi:hypothetical protein